MDVENLIQAAYRLSQLVGKPDPNINDEIYQNGEVGPRSLTMKSLNVD